MKRGRKALQALLLVFAMVLTLFGGVKVTKADDETITGTSGTIQVTKYKYDRSVGQNPADPERGEATGTEVDETGISADTYQPLKGAKFELYKVADADYVKNYYSGLGRNQGESFVADLDLNNMITKDSNTNVVSEVRDVNNARISKTDTTKVKFGTTNESGQITFDVDLGIYILIEVQDTESVKQVTAPLAEPALITVPMVNSKTSNNGDGQTKDKWLYDIKVYPKNPVAEASVELTKKGKNPKNGNDVPLDGVTFELSKKTGDGDNDWTPITSTTDINGNNVAFNLVTDGNGQIKIEHLTPGVDGTTYRLIEKSVKAGTGYIVDPTPIVFKVNTNNTIEFVSATQAGDTTAEQTTVTHEVNENTLILTVKNYLPTMKKEVKVNAATEEWKQYAQYSIGNVETGRVAEREIQYKITVGVPENLAELTEFKLVDEPAVGITDTMPTSVVYTGGSVTLEEGTTVYKRERSENDYSKGFVIDFAQMGDQRYNIAGKEVTITYTAYLNENADIAQHGNANTATLSYDKIMKQDNGTYKIQDSAVVYTYSLKIKKVNGSDEPLSGVQFELHKQADGNDAAIKVVGTDGKYHVAGKDETNTITTIETKTEDGADKGTLIITGLENNTYYLKEIKTLEGYNLLTKPFAIQINADDTEVTWNITNQRNEDTLIKHEGASERTANVQPEKTIINRKGFVLPQTGTFGYLMVFAIGFVLIIGGVVLMLSGRKKVIK